MYVSGVCSKCFICSRRMLQVFCLDVAYTCMLQVFHMYVYKCYICVSSGCCLCLQWFSNVLQVFFASVSSVFFCMLQLFVSGCFKSRPGVAHEMHVGSGRRRRRRPGRRGRRLRRRGNTWCAHSRAQRGRHSFALCAGSVRTLVPGLDVRH
jgi:hypothetical protein